ncbi:MAG: cation-translocating P-type ATPase [Aquabacterium sp.]
MSDSAPPSHPEALPTGLSAAEAQARLQRLGFNELPQAGRRTIWRMLLEAFKEPMQQLLIGAGVIYLLLGDVHEAAMLLAFVAVSMAITLFQEARSERVLEALRDLSSPRAQVIRDGQRVRIAGREVVEGDLLVLEEGDRIAADARVMIANDLQTDESLLTGEAVPVTKVAAGLKDEGAAMRPGGDGQPWVYSGSMIVRGQGLAVVTATGPRTEIGRIGVALRDIAPESSALQAHTRRLVRLFGFGGMAISVSVALIYWATRGEPVAALLAGITLAMSMLPQEFLLIFAVFMAMGAWRISQQRVLVRRASAVEALGTTTVLCTDKTGTLTLNRMRIAALHAQGVAWQVAEGASTMTDAHRLLLSFGILASERQPFDPMEKAFWALGEQAFVPDDPHWHPDGTLAHEYALSPEMLAMTHVWQLPGHDGHVVATKGAPEAVADLCHMPDAERVPLRGIVEAMASRGMRVLAVARSRHPGVSSEADWPAIQHDFDFEFLGLVGLEDPLRPAVPAAVKACRDAGIRVAMITGDHPATALAMASQAGLDVSAGLITGEEMKAMSNEALARRIGDVSVFARVMPEQKLRLVKAFQAQGEVVAMTGDGVNDAPSLKAADIGVAMGQRGTDVAREASAVVLLDDEFGTIVDAVRLGRRIDDNLRKAMAFVMAVHVPIAGLSLLPLLMGLPLLFHPVHIAFLELIIDPVCSIVFEAEPEERDIMQRPPRAPDRPLLSGELMVWSLMQGLIALGVVGACYVWLLQAGAPETMARAGGFIALVGANVALIFSNRSFGSNLIAAVFKPNRAMWRMLAITAGLLALSLWWAPVRALFRFDLPDAATWQVAGLASLLTLILLEMLKAVRRHVQRPTAHVS